MPLMQELSKNLFDLALQLSTSLNPEHFFSDDHFSDTDYDESESSSSFFRSASSFPVFILKHPCWSWTSSNISKLETIFRNLPLDFFSQPVDGLSLRMRLLPGVPLTDPLIQYICDYEGIDSQQWNFQRKIIAMTERILV